MKNLRHPAVRSVGFTLVELLVVITIVAILAGVAFAAYAAVQERAKRTATQVAIKNVETALVGYRAAYRRLPRLGSGDALRTDSELMAVLLGLDEDANPAGTRFVDGAVASRSGSTRRVGGLVYPEDSTRAPSMVDSWGELLYVKMDMDYDGRIEEPGTGRTLFANICVWSRGNPNKDGFDDPEKWIRSW